jgi:MFS family permease
MITKQSSLLAPMRESTFAVLWSGVASAFLAQWMLPVTAQWFLVSRVGGLPLVPLVQVAISLPMALVAIPAGVLADNVDRRLMIIGVQVTALAAEITLVTLSMLGDLTPVVLLVMLAVLSSSITLTFTPFNSMVPDIVGRDSIPAASALLAIASNSTRVVGSALAGLVITWAGVSAGFGTAVPPTVVLLIVMLRWKPHRARVTARERFMPAVRSGLHYVRHSPQALKITVRALWFTTGIVALFSLLPVVAAELGAGSGQLGMLLAAQGAGAVLGALTIPRMRRLVNPNSIVSIGFTLAAAGLLVTAAASNLVAIALGSAAAGWSWTTVLATLQAELQMYLPACVRARGIATTLVATHGGLGIGGLGVGWIANGLTPRWGLIVGSVVLVSGALLALAWPLRKLPEVDRSMVRNWSSPELLLDPHELGGQVQVRVSYTIADGDEEAFVVVMHKLRRVRLRSGAIRWQLLRHSGVEGRFIEEFTVGSWAEYEQLMLDRAVVYDRSLESQAAALSTADIETHHLFRIETHAEAESTAAALLQTRGERP